MTAENEKETKSKYIKPKLMIYDSVKKITKAVTTGSADHDFGKY